MRIETWPIDRPKPYPKNPRKIPDGAVDKVAASIREFGFRQPVVVDKKGVVIVGHTRLLAARKLGLEEIPVHVAEGLSKAQVRAYRLADNRTNQEAAWDDDLLGSELFDLKGLEFDLDLTGFGGDEIDRLFAKMDAAEGLTDPDDVPEAPEEPITQPGDVWILGRHRLVCGDCTDADVVARCLNGAEPHLMVTSPPYNQKIDGFKPSGMHKEHGWVRKVGALAYTDSLPERDYQDRQRVALELWHSFLRDGGSVFYNHKNRYRDKRVLSPLQWLPGPFSLRQEIIWRRPGSVTQNARMFLPCDERIYWLYKGDKFTFNDDVEIKSWSTVWDIAPRPNLDHAVAFPVELPERCIRAASMPDDVVFDPYLGSGTTMIAAEKTSRMCAGIELSPAYCDVAVKRWEQFAGKEAVRESHDEEAAA